MRKFTINRWNFSQKAGKWVYVTKTKGGKRKYLYQLEPPAKFLEYTMKIKEINDQMLKTKDPEENERLFNRLMEYSKLMQHMDKE